MLPASETRRGRGPSPESEDAGPLQQPGHTAKTKQQARPLSCVCRNHACPLPRPHQVLVSSGGDAPVPADHLAVSEQDASWRDQGGRRQGVPPETGRDEGQRWGRWGLGRAAAGRVLGSYPTVFSTFKEFSACFLPPVAPLCSSRGPSEHRGHFLCWAWPRGSWVWFIGVPVPFPDIYGVADSPLQVIHGGLPGPSRGHIHCHRGP